MFEKITLKLSNGSSLDLSLRGITVFVGPNNSGKSLVLREIEQAFHVDPMPADLKLLKSYEISWPTIGEAKQRLDAFSRFKQPNLPEGYVSIGRMALGGGGIEVAHFHWAEFERLLSQKHNASWVVTQFLKWGVVRLDGRSRFSLTDDRPGDDLTAAPTNVLSHLFQDDAVRQLVRDIVRDAFGSYLVVDPTRLGLFRLRLSSTPPSQDEQSLNQAARDFHAKATHVKDASDGVQAFVGIVVSVLSGEYHTVLLDEPEAFLHPPLARKLGKHLAKIAGDRKGSLLASTHSSDFLMGCLSENQDVQVIRMDYRDGVSRARLVNNKKLRELFRNPLMRSANVISALFHDGVVVTESDNDRAFYGEIYHRLTLANPELPSLLFVNAQNKHTIPDVVSRLREFGVPAAGICDIDVLKEGGVNWSRWLEAGQLPKLNHGAYSTQRASLKQAFDKTGKDMKVGGVGLLEPSDAQAAAELFDTLAAYGVFVVRRGELESWLPSLSVPGKKTDWTVAMLNRLGDDPHDPSYVHPAVDDVWAFVKGVGEWVKSPQRKGVA